MDMIGRSHARGPSLSLFLICSFLMKAGGRDEGGPGPRPDYGPNWYAAYLRDPTGNKLAIVCRKPA